ncbi:MAG: tetratricopeptide repeat protein [Alphaproteobacteria bacterium]|nr:tetratricopeptide repeat protein [Alphaproteobacteria bacterium]
MSTPPAGGLSAPTGPLFPKANKGALYHMELGATYLELGSLSDAADAFRQAIALDPAMAEAHFNLGTVLSDQKNAKSAMAAYRRAAELRPDFFEAHFNLGETLVHLGLLDDAVDCYRRAAALQPDNPGLYNNLGTTFLETGHYDEAVEALTRAVALAPDVGELHTNLGAALKHAGRVDEGVKAQRRAVELSPDSAESHFNLAMVLASAGDHTAAEASYRQAIALKPDMPQLYTYLGSSLMSTNRHAEALALCDEFLARNPADRRILAFKVVLLAELGEAAMARALADYDRMIQPVDIEAPADFGDVATFNQALVRHIVEHPSLVVAPRSHATVDGQHTGDLLVEPKGPFAAFEGILWQAVEAYRQQVADGSGHPYFAHWPALDRLFVWAIVMRRGGHQVPHIHPAGWMSGVYYAELPADIGSEDGGHDGWIEFGRAPSGFPVARGPHIRMIQPKAGRLFLFPSYFYHRTVPNTTDARRVSIAFDFLPAV